MDAIHDSKEYKAYIEISRELQKYYQVDMVEPPKLTRKYEKILDEYRAFLDRLKMRLPAPLYPYSKHDKTTHKFLDCVVNDRKFMGAIENHEWAYKRKAELKHH